MEEGHYRDQMMRATLDDGREQSASTIDPGTG